MMNKLDDMSAKQDVPHSPADSGICDEDGAGLAQDLQRFSLTDSNKVMSSASDETGEWYDVVGGPGDSSKNFKVPPYESVQPTETNENECKSFTHGGANADSNSRNYTAAGFSDRCSSPAGRGRGRARSSVNPVSQPGGLQGSPGESAALGPGTGRGRGRGRAKENGAVVLQPSNDLKEPTIAALDHNNIDTLAMYLNNDSGTLIKNWRHLARECQIPESDRDALARAYSGGGNPALVFFDKLRKKNAAGNIAGLIEKLKKIQRNDCVLFVQRNPQLADATTAIKDLSEEIIEQLSSKLTEKSPVIKCWKNLASLYGYTRTEIAHIGSAIQEPGQYSPTRLLFATINAKNPDMTISELADKLRKLERNDVVFALEKMIREKQQANQ